MHEPSSHRHPRVELTLLSFAVRACIGACLGMIAALPAGGAGCIGPGAYACDSHAQCMDGGREGRCEDEGFCSFLDDECPSGRRFTEFAPRELARQCTDDGATSETSVGTTSPTDTGASASSSSAGESDDTVGPIPGCGNGMQDEGEDCDDENRIDDDACNNDCRVPGSPIWEMAVAGAGSDGDRGYAIAMHPDGDRFAVAGWLATAPAEADAFVAVYDLDGTEDWSQSHDGDDPEAWNEAREVVFADDGAVVVAGVEDSTATFVDGTSWISVYEPDGTERWHWGTGSADARDGYLRAAALDGDDVIAVGHVPGEAWIGRIAEGVLVEELVRAGDGAPMAWSITRGEDDRWWIVGHDDVQDAPEVYWVLLYAADLAGEPIVVDTGASVATGESAPYGNALAPDGRVWVCGTRAPVLDRDAWLQPFSAEGREGPEIAFDMGANDFGLVDDVTFAADGSFVATGGMGPTSTNDLDIWVWSFSADGELRWSTPFEGDAGEVDRGWGVRLDEDGNPVVVGYMTDTSADPDVWIARLAR